MHRMNLAKWPLDGLKRLAARIPSPRRRTLLLVVPVHVVAFTLLFFGTMRVVEIEILRAHSLDARHLLEEAVEDIHPLMVGHDRGEVPRAVGEYAHAHKLLDLRIFRKTGAEMGSADTADPEVVAFLAGAEEELFRFDREGQQISMLGMRRLRSEDGCIECHTPGATLGVATMRIDLSDQMGAARGNLRRNLAMLIAGWTLLVGVVNIGLGTMTRRSMARLNLPSAVEENSLRQSDDASGLVLDPVSAELYESLQRLIESQRSREAEVSGRLRRAEHMASLGELAAGLAHEIKNPLAGIRGVIELLRDESEDESQRNLFEQIVTELDRINRTIHSLLSFARPSLPKPIPTDILELIEDSLQLIRPNLGKQNITLEVEVAPDVTQFRLDATHIRHVLVNLVKNAADAIENDGEILVRAITSPDGNDLFLSVTDDGPGIAAHLHDKIFEPFYSTKFTGTGLGLAVVDSLVSRSGGVIELISEPGRGATFFVLLSDEAAESESVGLETKG
jgi:signal transduction histidine kinase